MQATIDAEQSFKFPVLVGDIGGTNARFALLVDSYAEPKEFPIVQTADYTTIDEAIQSAVLDHTSILPRSVILAVAGPVDGDEIDLTNCDWVVRPKGLITNLGFKDVTVLNDFEAQALAVVSLESEHLEQIGGKREEIIATRVVLGPGTGLGVAGLIRTHKAWVPVPGEGGHIDIGPRSERDYQVFPHIERIEGRVAAEQILCGRGLRNLYVAICAADNVPPVFDTPAAITDAGLDGSNPQAVETLDLFVTYLGRIAGDLALIFMALGGVYLSGGIPQRILSALKAESFRAAFEDKAPHGLIMRDIPIHVITHQLAALSGLSAFARTPSRFEVSTDGRRWHIG
ncbi:glucokinase [Falsochrobactrum sp. TDYN1]|uniref:Glucokinase n=1 Tax=Falsochrobactrum tianjinense TaxID=2706015 RepID=A0A949UUU7_9HYPH|nr:glucokinase [Falsochrobactrum sp. TDYN1]MBV2144177.1 glucokinase [Falsochrobactrum sp. TDYN1]